MTLLFWMCSGPELETPKSDALLSTQDVVHLALAGLHIGLSLSQGLKVSNHQFQLSLSAEERGNTGLYPFQLILSHRCNRICLLHDTMAAAATDAMSKLEGKPCFAAAVESLILNMHQ